MKPTSPYTYRERFSYAKHNIQYACTRIELYTPDNVKNKHTGIFFEYGLYMKGMSQRGMCRKRAGGGASANGKPPQHYIPPVTKIYMPMDRTM